MKYSLNDKAVEIVETQYDDGMVMVIGAVYIDSGNELNDTELNELQDNYQDSLIQDHYETYADYAHDSFDTER